MKVKRILLCGLTCFMVAVTLFGSMSCSDDDDEVEHDANEDTLKMVQKTLKSLVTLLGDLKL